MKNTQVKAFCVAFQGADSGILKLNPNAYGAQGKGLENKIEPEQQGFVKEDSNEDHTQAQETSDYMSLNQLHFIETGMWDIAKSLSCGSH